MQRRTHRYRNQLSYSRKHKSGFFARVGIHLGLPVVLLFIAVVAATGSLFIPPHGEVNVHSLMAGLCISFLRLVASYVISVVIAVPLALLAERSHRFESILLPMYDVLESVPVLAFFPVIILFFVRLNWLEAAAIFIIVLNMVWNIVFNLVGGLKLIPKDITSAAQVLGYRGFAKLEHILLPALFPALVTGSILALAEGWNMLIVAEVLHAYAPAAASVPDLFGIGSQLVSAASSGQTLTFFWAAGIIVVAVSVVNVCLWQPLLSRAERYKFE